MPRPALFVIDMLNDCFGHAELLSRRAALCDSINDLTHLARLQNIPVFWVRQEYSDDLSDATLDMQKEQIKMFIKGTPGAEILPELVRAKDDQEVIKKRYSVFYGTGLDETLSGLMIDTIILAGVNTHACVSTSAVDAYQRDLNVFIVRECVASKDPNHHEVSLNYLNDAGIASIVGLKEIKDLLVEN